MASYDLGLAEVFSEVCQERARQHVKFGDQRGHSHLVWNTILGEEVGEAAEQVLEATFPNAHREVDPIIHLRTELLQVAAVAIAWIQAIDNPIKRKPDELLEAARMALKNIDDGHVESAGAVLEAAINRAQAVRS